MMACDVRPAFFSNGIVYQVLCRPLDQGCVRVYVCVWICALIPHAGRRLAGCCSRPAPSRPQCRSCLDLPGTSSQLLLATQGQTVTQIKYAEGVTSTSSCLHHAMVYESCRPNHLSAPKASILIGLSSGWQWQRNLWRTCLQSGYVMSLPAAFTASEFFIYLFLSLLSFHSPLMTSTLNITASQQLVAWSPPISSSWLTLW